MQQLTWLTEQLAVAQSQGQLVIICCHLPLHPDTCELFVCCGTAHVSPMQRFARAVMRCGLHVVAPEHSPGCSA